MNVRRIALFSSLVAVVAAVGAGLFVAGSPVEQRLRRLDDRRVDHLRSLASAADRYFEREERLPGAAAELVDGLFLTRVPTDPATQQPYEYRVTGPRQFELCATFDRPSRPELADDFWAHETGRRCYAFTAANNPLFGR